MLLRQNTFCCPQLEVFWKGFLERGRQMDFSHAGDEVDLGSYKTPLIRLARRFKASVELWKAKYRQLKSEIKRYQNRANDARRSRDHWKEQAQQWKASAEQFQAEFNLLRSQDSGPKNKETTARGR